MNRMLCAVVLLLLLLPCASAEELSDREPTARVWVNGTEVENVYETAVCTQRFWEENPTLSTAPAAIAVQEAPYLVEIAFSGIDVQSAVVRPLEKGIVPEIQEGKVCFRVEDASQLVIEVNGEIRGAVHLFLDTPDAEKPGPDTPKVRYFGPGVYRDQIITVRSNETIYLDEGCVLYGQIYSGLASNFTIAGHGVLCGSIYVRWKDTIVPVNLSNCSDFTIRDITIRHVVIHQFDGLSNAGGAPLTMSRSFPPAATATALPSRTVRISRSKTVLSGPGMTAWWSKAITGMCTGSPSTTARCGQIWRRAARSGMRRGPKS